MTSLFVLRVGTVLGALLCLGSAAFAQQPRPADMPQKIVWVDRDGQILGQVGSVQQSIFYPALSPDDRWIAVSARDGEVNDRDVWVHDVVTGAKALAAGVRGNDNLPVWSPDGRRLAFTSNRGGDYDLYIKDLNSDEPERVVLATGRRQFPRDWSPDGRLLAYTREDLGSPVRDIFFLRLDQDPMVELEVLKAPGTWHDAAQFSPNGRYLAYASNADGPWEVWVLEVDRPERRWKVSRPLSAGWAGGGGQPRWRGDGGELFYVVGNDTMMAVEVTTDGANFTHGTPVRLFSLPGMRGNFPEEMPWLQKYDVTGDGQRFVFVRTVGR
jgi:eukaryotic-like serine/threonine-protein kinase